LNIARTALNVGMSRQDAHYRIAGVSISPPGRLPVVDATCLVTPVSFGAGKTRAMLPICPRGNDRVN
jgi:hypothetical protein